MGGGEDSDDPLFLDLPRACTPHLGWLWAAFNLVKAVHGLKSEDWRGLLHVTTSPTPRAGKVNPDVLPNGFGLVGSHVIPQDIWEKMVPPEFYGQG